MAETAQEYGSMALTISVGELDGKVYGLFFRGGIRHIAAYQPYCRPPVLTLCSRGAGAATRTFENMCPECKEKAESLLGKLVFK